MIDRRVFTKVSALVCLFLVFGLVFVSLSIDEAMFWSEPYPAEITNNNNLDHSNSLYHHTKAYQSKNNHYISIFTTDEAYAEYTFAETSDPTLWSFNSDILPNYAPFVDLMPLENGSFLLSTLSTYRGNEIDFTHRILDTSQSEKIIPKASQTHRYNSTTFERVNTTNDSYKVINYFNCYYHSDTIYIVIEIIYIVIGMSEFIRPDLKSYKSFRLKQGEVGQTNYKVFKFKDGELTKSEHSDFIIHATNPEIQGSAINTVVKSNGESYTLFEDGSILKYTDVSGWELFKCDINQEDILLQQLVELNNNLEIFYLERLHQFSRLSYEYNADYQVKQAKLELKQNQFLLTNPKKICTIEDPWFIVTPLVDVSKSQETIRGLFIMTDDWYDSDLNRYYKHEFTGISLIEPIVFAVAFLAVLFGLNTFYSRRKFNTVKGNKEGT